MKLFAGRLLSILFVAGGWLLIGARTVLDLVGYSTVPDDTKVALGRLDEFFVWLLSVPWWAPWTFALISTVALMFVSWPRQAVAGQATPPDTTPKGTERPFEMEVPRHRPGDSVLVAMQKATRSLRSMEELVSTGQLPSTLSVWKAFTEQLVSVQLSMEKAGMTVPYLNPDTDPIGWVDRYARFFNRITPLVEAGHTSEAAVAAMNLSAKLQNEHPGPNGRQALQ